MERYTIDTARDSNDVHRIHHIVRDTHTDKLRAFDTRALALEWIATHSYPVIRCDTDEVLFIGATYTEARAYCTSEAVKINGHSQALALTGRPAIRIPTIPRS